MAKARTLKLDLSANLDDFAARLLEQMAEQFEVAADGARAAADALRDETRVVHMAPLPDIGTVTTCCGRVPDTELPGGDRLTNKPELVTCEGLD